MSAMRLPFLAFALVGAITACRPDSPVARPGLRFHFTVERNVYAPGEVARGALYNDGSAPMGYSTCQYFIDRRDASGAWEVAEGIFPPCAAVAQAVRARDSVHWQATLPPTLAAGTYRVRFPGTPNDTTFSGPPDVRSSPPFGIVSSQLVVGFSGLISRNQERP